MVNLNIENLIKNDSARRLPVYKIHCRILDTILNNQVTLITGETGCGKSTQVPRILYEYMKAVKLPGKVLCVEPRRLAGNMEG
jgi:HrpA-like RNA helicase